MSALEFPGDEGHYVVTAPMVMVKRTTGVFVQLLDNAPVPADVDPKHRDHLLDAGLIRLSDAAPQDLQDARKSR